MLGAAAAMPAHAQPDAAGGLLDRAAQQPPAEALAMLARLDLAMLPPARRLDVEAARAGLAIDVALARAPDDYHLRLQRQLGTTPDLDQIAARLDGALETLHARAASLFDRIGVTGPTVGARYARLFRDERFLYADSEAGREAATADMAKILAAQRGRVAAQIAGVPAFCLDVGVRSLSTDEVAAGKGGYREPPAPGRPGTYIVDLRRIRDRPSWTLPSVVAHELLPGHMVQLGLEAIARPHALRITYAAHFVEGWAIHAEQLALEKLPAGAVRARLGGLHWLIFRAVRGRVDYGLHRQGWSLDHARTRLEEWQGVPAYFAPFESDLARIAADPAIRAAEAFCWLTLTDRSPRNSRRRASWYGHVVHSGRLRLEQLQSA